MTTPTDGAHWIRAALQVNPFAYQGLSAPSESYPDEQTYNAALLDKCAGLGIQLLAVTDHWCVESAAGLIADGQARDLTVLPGFEANSSEGIHALVLFEAGTPFSTINAAIGQCGGTPGNANQTGEPFLRILEEMDARGALVIAAHVNVKNSGLLTNRGGPPLAKMVTSELLHAIGITPSQPDGVDQKSVCEGRQPYSRNHPLAVIHADDIMHPDKLAEVGATTWFKVGSPSLEGLKIAVRTPQTRVCVHDPTGDVRAVIRSISWKGGFLDGVKTPLSSDLTALIGGRGTGKSTVIESLRYVLCVDPIGAASKKDHKAIISEVLGPGTIVSAQMDAVSPSKRRYRIERMVQGAPTVYDEGTGKATNLTPSDVIGVVEMYGQHELAELSQDKGGVARMLHRLAGSAGDDPELSDLQDKLLRNREDLARGEDDLNKLEEELSDMPRLEDAERRFAETDLPTKLAEKKALDSEEAQFSQASQTVQDQRTKLEPLLSLVAELSQDEQDEPNGADPRRRALDALNLAVVTLQQELSRIAIETASALARAEKTIAQAKVDWGAATSALREGHAALLRDLSAEGHDVARYDEVTGSLALLRQKAMEKPEFLRRIKRLTGDRADLMAALAAHEKESLKQLHDAVRSANVATRGVVVVKPVEATDRNHIMEIIDAHISGHRTQIRNAIEDPGFSPRAFAEAARAGIAQLSAQYQITGAQAQSILNAGEALWRKIEEQTVGYAVDVELDVGAGSGTRQYKKLDDLSKGQKATALLLLLLGASTGVLVIDQPEDDLDNRLIYDGVVKRLRELKGERQIVVATHNANVPVLGDAELVVALEGDGRNGRPIEGGVGSLDDAVIRRLVEDILEGGEAAFNARQHLYGF